MSAKPGLVLLALASVAALAGCSLYHNNGPGNSFTLHVRNNTLRTVTVIGPGPGSDKTTLARHEGVYIYVPNDRSGVARMRVVSEGKTLGCFTVPYRKGEKRMTVLVTGAKPCSS